MKKRDSEIKYRSLKNYNTYDVVSFAKLNPNLISSSIVMSFELWKVVNCNRSLKILALMKRVKTSIYF